ncbi:4'-phosphopantetheinyl transferase family protein [Falsiroseomonas sp. E2-1-a20]|uniref:4'-phosphopantetheinyl transferase family protein n=1 Tax=Falsiroseomonas sp. E2-1-a20 TaxID=3239300 RepID=UPI003F311695
MRRGAVRLRWVAPEDAEAATLATWHATLDAAERAKAARFHFARDRDAYIAAHALARAMLSDVAPLPPNAWRFVSGQAGKPEVDPALGLPWLRFNISHTRGLVACAVTNRDDVGLDVEDLDRREASPGLAERHFAPAEVALLAATPPAARHETFLRVWTLKEAFVKATGDGISLGLDRFAFTLDPPRLTLEAGDAAPWRFLQWQPTPRHILAVALRRL